MEKQEVKDENIFQEVEQKHEEMEINRKNKTEKSEAPRGPIYNCKQFQ